ncbi:signal peptidase I [Atopobacter phocae]|uniref:signal peptidase I n=1 Tax=Atopobacter phocae TaxID=136492 RepID=UPI00046E583B|nr:signal peptidase I [Atopobacter phocae]
MNTYEANRRKMRYLVSIILAVMTVLFIRTYLFFPVEVSGRSMSPTIESNDTVLLTPYGEIQRFDIILFTGDSHETYIKRVIGLPGDEIEYYQNELLINGKKIEEPFLSIHEETTNFKLEDIGLNNKVPPAHYFVLGDNRSLSYDSRMLGFVPQDSVLGRVVCRLQPFERL